MSRFLIRVAGASAAALALVLSSCSGDGLSEPSGSAQSPAPESAFTAAPTEGVAPLAVNFTNQSTGATQWLWEFGDGSVSTEKNPVHEYAVEGTYTVRLTAENEDGGSDVAESVDLVRAEESIGDASFEGQVALEEPGPPWESFTGTALGTVSGHLIRSLAVGPGEEGLPSAGAQWCEISSITTSAALPPSNPGGLTEPPTGGAGVRQDLRYPQGRSVLQLDAAFVDGEAPQTTADWMSIDISDGSQTFNLYFRDVSSADLGTSALHQGAPITPRDVVTADLLELFPSSTSDTVFTLTAQVGNAGDGFDPSWGYVDNLRFEPRADDPLEAEFTSPQQIGATNTPILFQDASQPAGAAKSWVWDFGDQQAATDPSPVHFYETEGTFTVSQSVAAPGTSDVEEKTDFILIDDDACAGPVISIVSANCGPPPFKVQVVGSGSQNVTKLRWNFGDPTGTNNIVCVDDITQIVEHTYSNVGEYTIKLTGWGTCFPPSGSDCSTLSGGKQVTSFNAVNVVAVPVFDFTITSSPGASCKPPSAPVLGGAFPNVPLTFKATLISGEVNEWVWRFDGPFSKPTSVKGSTTVVFPGYSDGDVGTKQVILQAKTTCASVSKTNPPKELEVLHRWGELHATIVVDKCTGCHSSAGGEFSMVNVDTAYAALVGEDMVYTANGGNACSKPINGVSVAIAKRIWGKGNNACPSCGCSPLFNGQPAHNSDLSGLKYLLESNGFCLNQNMKGMIANEKQRIFDWIDYGAPNN